MSECISMPEKINNLFNLLHYFRKGCIFDWKILHTIRRPDSAMKFYVITCYQAFSVNMKTKFSIGQEKKSLENSRFLAIEELPHSLQKPDGEYLHLKRHQKTKHFISLKNDQ